MRPDQIEEHAAPDNAVLQSVERALADLRRGLPVVVERADGQAALAQAAEVISDKSLRALSYLAGTEPLLILTARRAAALGITKAEPLLSAGGVIALSLSGRRADRVIELADPAKEDTARIRRQTLASAPESLDVAAVDLAKLARLLPAALLAPIASLGGGTAGQWAASNGLFRVAAAEVADYRLAAARALSPVAEARVPLLGAENTRIVAFRPDDGGIEHLAMIIGEPSADQPVLVRLHSECFTGDLLASLRCDCGDQLRGAIEAIAAAGAGVVLYLTQEGRGIGLVNKLRAYALQDRGADTAEANETLGFDADERVYLPAAEMLRQLGFRRVRLLTNNPEKVKALAHCGISIEERVPHSFPSNDHNEFYLATKATRFGHLF
jgi:GTP cyclohydrolase II